MDKAAKDAERAIEVTKARTTNPLEEKGKAGDPRGMDKKH